VELPTNHAHDAEQALTAHRPIKDIPAESRSAHPAIGPGGADERSDCRRVNLVRTKLKLTEGKWQWRANKSSRSAPIYKETYGRRTTLATKAKHRCCECDRTDVNGVKTDLDATKGSLNNCARARRIDCPQSEELEQLRRNGEPDYFDSH